ncbi:MAG TPA: hypothetical protein ENN84_09170 [Candidatus Marinimicrobia bacterium]|nr:hypothetical protein [Candidatus Neomarinimicrobiota bacterium]
MPNYDYKCKKCTHRFEQFQGINDSPVKLCPRCGGEVRRVIRSVGLIFKGSGFYITDYTRKKTNEQKKSTASESGSGDTKT